MLINEVAYLLERLGNNRQMILCLIDMGDYRGALNKIVNSYYTCEPELWDLVVNFCITKKRYNMLLKSLLKYRPEWTYVPVSLNKHRAILYGLCLWMLPLERSGHP